MIWFAIQRFKEALPFSPGQFINLFRKELGSFKTFGGDKEMASLHTSGDIRLIVGTETEFAGLNKT